MARKDIALSSHEITELLQSSHTIQVATIGTDGWPHLAPMWFVLDAEGRIQFRTFTKSQKLVNLQRRPQVTVLAEAGEAYGELKGVMIKGSAQLSTDREKVMDVYTRVAVKYGLLGEAEPTPELVEATLGRHADKNTAVTVEPHSIASWDHSKLGGAY